MAKAITAADELMAARRDLAATIATLDAIRERGQRTIELLDGHYTQLDRVLRQLRDGAARLDHITAADPDPAVTTRRTGPAPATCPSCWGRGVLSDDPQVFRCTSCSGVFTSTQPITIQQALQFVLISQPMLPQAHDNGGTFYFDLDIYIDPRTMVGDYRRMHGWADAKTKRVVQFG